MKSSFYTLLTTSISAGFLLACGTQNHEQASTLDSADAPVQNWMDPMVMQRGYDLVSSVTKGDCTAPGTLIPGLPGTDGNIGSWRIDFIQSTQDLQTSLEVSTAARLGAATGDARSAKATYSNSLHLNSYSVYLLASVQIEKAAQNYRDVKLKPNYETLLHSTNPDKMKIFRQRCGDRFVIGQKAGGEYTALIEINTTSRAEKERISASVKNKVGLHSAGAGFAAALNSLSTDYELHFSTLKIGGTSDPIPTDPKAIIERAVNFEKEVDSRPVPYKAILAEYVTLENFPFEDPISPDAALMVMEKINTTLSTIDQKRADILYILSHPTRFAAVDGAYLSDKINALNQAENILLKAASECTRNIDNCSVPSDLGDIAVTLPE